MNKSTLVTLILAAVILGVLMIGFLTGFKETPGCVQTYEFWQYNRCR